MNSPTSMQCLGMLWTRPETSSRMPGLIPSEPGSVARGRRKPSRLGSVEALSQNSGGLTGQSGAGVHVGDLHDPQTAPIRFHADLHAGSGWDRNITCTLEDREVEKGIRSRAAQRHEAELLVEAEPTYACGQDPQRSSRRSGTVRGWRSTRTRSTTRCWRSSF